MIKNRGYKIVILVLSLVIMLQWVFIFKISARKKIPEVPLVIKGKIAIVIDDWGYNVNNLPIVSQINYPFTASILPNLPNSGVVANLMHRRGKEVILHLPMEPHERFRLEQSTITTLMNEQTIKSIVGQDLSNIPHAVGVSNHMGSKATEDLRTMSIVFSELKKRNLFFLDSLVSSKSICADLANKISLRFIKRDVFLDNEEKAEYIRGQIYKLKMKARLYGQAVGIGHDRKITLEVLRDAMPELEKEGYKFVFVSELAR